MTFDYVAPTISESINRLTFIWPPFELKVIADRVTDAGTAELWFYHQNGTGDSLLHSAKVNLMSSSTMNQIAKRMSQHSADVPWIPVMTCITARTMEYQRRGDPGTVIEPDLDHIEHPGYYVEPVVMKGVPTVIYGDKGVNKTTLALAFMGCIATGTESSLGVTCSGTARVAMLDWESNEKLTNYATSRLIKGGVIQWFKLPYLRCKQSMADDIDRIANFLHDNRTDVVLIDSLGQAAGNDKFDSAGKGAALKFFECLRQLDITSVIIAQNSKNEDEGKKTIYGSTYYTYYARNIFELQGKRDEQDSDRMHLALFHRESNYSKKYAPMGFMVDYTDTTINISTEETSYSEWFEKTSQTKEVLEFLKAGAKTAKAISEALEFSENRTKVILTRAKKRGLVIQLGSGLWGLKIEVSKSDN